MKKRYILMIFAVICGILALISANRSAATAPENAVAFLAVPVQSFNSGLGERFNGIISVFKSNSDLSKENGELKSELLSARAEINRLRLIEEENKQLEALLKMKQVYPDYELVGASVIAKDPGNWYRSFTIDKGSNSGLKKDMVVITGEGLVGKISECGKNYSKVISIINDTDAVTVKSLRSQDTGFVTGSFSADNACIMQYTDDNADFVVGDELVTSNLSDIFPAGITVGNVERLAESTNEELFTADVRPAVDFKHLNYVLVIKHSFGEALINEELPQETEK